MLEEKLMIRRLKKHVLAELPPKLRQKVPINVDRKVLREISKILNRDLPDDDAKEALLDGIEQADEKIVKEGTLNSDAASLLNEVSNLEEEALNFNKFCSITSAYQLTGEAKIAGIIEYIDTLLEA